MSDLFCQVLNFLDSITTTIPIHSSADHTMPAKTATETVPADQQAAPVLTIDGVAYDFNSLSDRARMLSVDFVRTDQEWNELQHRYRQFVAMEVTYVNSLKEEVEKAKLEPVYTSDPEKSEVPLLTIDQVSYDASTIPDAVRLYVEDLVRNNQERGQLEFRLRQLDAARSAFLEVIRQELKERDGEQHDNQEGN